MADMSGWQSLGEALGGGAVPAQMQGMMMGARFQDMGAMAQSALSQIPLHGAQTALALEQARAARKKNTAQAVLPQTLQALGVQHPHATAGAYLASGGTFDQFSKGLGDLTRDAALRIKADPLQMGTPAYTAATALLNNTLPGPQAVPDTFTLPAGVAPPNVQQTPAGAAATAQKQAQASLQGAEAGLYKGATASNPAVDAGLYAMAVRARLTGQMPNYAMFGSGPMANALRQKFDAFYGQVTANPDWVPPSLVLPGSPGSSGPTPPPASRPPGVRPPGAQGAPQTSPSPTGTQPPLTMTPQQAQGAALLPLVQKAYHDWSGEGPNGQRLIGYRTVANSLPVLQQTIQALGNGNNTVWNAVRQHWNTLTGDPAPTNMELAPEYVANETLRALRGSGVFSEQEMARLNKAWSVARSPAQLQGAVQLTRDMLQSGLQGMRAAYHTSMRGLAGSNGIPTFDDLLAGNVPSLAGASAGAPASTGVAATAPGGSALPSIGAIEDGYRFLGGNPADQRNWAPATTAQPPQIPPQAISQLRDGIVTTFGNGQRWTLRNGAPARVQ
jgi:hypothetical protein